jgi:anti-anti-sigma factor
MADPAYSYFDVKHHDDVAILRAKVHEIRHPPAAREFGAEVESFLERDDARRLLIDLYRTEYLGSTAFATLITLARKLAADGGALKLCGLHPDVLVGANIIGLGRIVEVHPDEASALAAFRA